MSQSLNPGSVTPRSLDSGLKQARMSPNVAADLFDCAPSGPGAGHLRRLKAERLGVFADMLVQIVGGIGERGEHEDPTVALVDRTLLLVPDGLVQALELGVMLGVDVPDHGE